MLDLNILICVDALSPSPPDRSDLCPVGVVPQVEAWLRSPSGAEPSTLPGSGCGQPRGDDDSPGTTAAAGWRAYPAHQGRRGSAVEGSAGAGGGPDVVHSLFAYPLMDNYEGECMML